MGNIVITVIRVVCAQEGVRWGGMRGREMSRIEGSKLPRLMHHSKRILKISLGIDG